MNSKIKFSALCSVYCKEKPHYIDSSLSSIATQTLTPTEIIIVHDGPLTNELYDVINKWKKHLPIKEAILSSNSGLGKALNYGLTKCSHELVARFDTDDINRPHRFERQIRFLLNNEDISVVSCPIQEFKDTPGDLNSVKTVPTEKIKQYAKLRNPINHMASAFRRSDVLKSGGYRHHPFMEDYNLWLRMISIEQQLGNLDDILVDARVGNGMHSRRKGFPYLKSEVELFHIKNRHSITNSAEGAIILIARIAPRLLPTNFLKALYQLLRSKKR